MMRLNRKKVDDVTCLFSYSYTAKRPFEAAKAAGWKTVLGQIDPGPVEERLVRGLPGGSAEPRIPEPYWAAWRQECLLADHILVNSGWSKSALVQDGVAEDKISIVPLAYEAPVGAAHFQRSYPPVFSRDRPLRVLFLGQANRRKGMTVVLDAMSALRNAPIELWIVGAVSVDVPQEVRTQRNIRWIGPVARRATEVFYQAADVFLFPTFSDGFGLTQLEAQAWKLPIIASRFCGDVVRPGVNGLLLEEVTVDNITAAVSSCLNRPDDLAAMSARSGIEERFTVKALSAELARLTACSKT